METGRGGDRREKEVVPVWRERILCPLSVDRPVKLRRAQSHRRGGFTGLCSFLCGSGVSTVASADPLAPCLVPHVRTVARLLLSAVITGLPT